MQYKLSHPAWYKKSVRSDLETTEHGSSVVLADEKGTRRAVLGSLPLEGGRTRSTEPPSSRTLLDKEGKVTWQGR
jgi:hypothetical protein